MSLCCIENTKEPLKKIRGWSLVCQNCHLYKKTVIEQNNIMFASKHYQGSMVLMLHFTLAWFEYSQTPSFCSFQNELLTKL